MKKLLTLTILLTTFSCTSLYQKEMSKTAKSGAASQRINSTQENSRDVLKDLD